MTEQNWKHKEPLMCRVVKKVIKLDGVCGHRIDVSRQPNTNCRYCWFNYFISHKQDIGLTLARLKEGKEAEVTAERGKKFIKQLKALSQLFFQVQEEIKTRTEEPLGA